MEITTFVNLKRLLNGYSQLIDSNVPWNLVLHHALFCSATQFAVGYQHQGNYGNLVCHDHLCYHNQLYGIPEYNRFC